MATLRDRLRSGDLWIDGSRNYRRFDAYLLPRSEVPAAAAVLRLPATGEAYIAERTRRLDWRLRRFAGTLPAWCGRRRRDQKRQAPGRAPAGGRSG